MKKFLLLFSLTLVQCQHELFPDIQDLFQTFHDDPFDVTQLRRSGVYIKNISLNIEKMDINKFKKKFNFTQFNESLSLNKTRRLAWTGTKWEFKDASELQVKIKCLDIMLEIIYMARHKLKSLENEKLFNPKDTSYRISFLYRRIRRIWRKMKDILATILAKTHVWTAPWTYLNPYLILHHKAAKLHVDFLYLWWVQVKLHEKYCQFHGIPNIIKVV